MLGRLKVPGGDWGRSSVPMDTLPGDGRRPSPELWERGGSLPCRVAGITGGPVAATEKWRLNMEPNTAEK